ncbi:MAG: hypothetical protein M3Q05_01760 [Bacteroidota bacterium]|nr:hypothetical protein [Bacteroidota bacterium]
MKFRIKFFAVFIFIGSLLPNSDFHELSKISTLLQHYQEHKGRTTNPLSFLDFLKMHYACADNNTSDNHDNLPFKHMGNSAYDYFVSTPVLQSEETFQVFMPEKHYVHLNFVLPGQFTGSIWQPPQTV